MKLTIGAVILTAGIAVSQTTNVGLRASGVASNLARATSAPPAAAAGAIPVDVYQDMESGNAGDVLTPALMNASSHGRETWTNSPGTTMRISTNIVRNLPGPVFVGGTTCGDQKTTRSWVFQDSNTCDYVTCLLPGNCPKITLACYYTPGVTIRFSNQFDTIGMTGYQGFSVLQTRNDDGTGPYLRAHSCATGWKTTFSPGQIKIVSGKTYWVNLHFDAVQGKTFVAAYDPDQAFAQVGDIIVANSWTNSSGMRRIWFGRGDRHGNNPTARTQSYFGHILIDYSHGAFPLLPGASAPTGR